MIALVMILAAGLGDEVPVPEVPLWSRFETTVVNPGSYANPFTDVTLVATFLRPDKSRVSFWGFYDGDGRGAPDVQRVLDYLQQVQVMSGEMDIAALPCYADDCFGFIDPGRDGYKTPLLSVGPQ
jgi:hypothetical protein